MLSFWFDSAEDRSHGIQHCMQTLQLPSFRFVLAVGIITGINIQMSNWPDKSRLSI